MKNANKFRRNQLILAIIFITIGIASSWGMVEVVYESYEYATPISNEPYEIELFGPKEPVFKFNYDYEKRFLYDSEKETTNC